MRQEETFDTAFEHDNLDVFISFQSFDDFVQLWNRFRAEDVERRMIEPHAPISGRSSREKNLIGPCWVVHWGHPLKQRLGERLGPVSTN